MTRQVQLSERAYALLKASKREGESFSDVVERLCPPNKDWRSFVGSVPSPLSTEQWLELAEWVRGGR